MNKKQLIVMWVAIALIIGFILYPPKHQRMVDDPIYSFIAVSDRSIDLSRLALECIGVLIIAAGALVTAGRVKT